MKKWWIVCLLLVPSASWAQHAGDKEIAGQIGYQYWRHPDVHELLRLSRGRRSRQHNPDLWRSAELLHSRLLCRRVPVLVLDRGSHRPPQGNLPDTKIGDLATQYIQVYGTRYVPVKPEKMDAFVMGGLGATGYSADGFDSRWLFSFGIGLGLKIHTNEKMSLRLQQRFLVPIQWGEGGFYFGTGGAGVSVGGGSSIIKAIPRSASCSSSGARGVPLERGSGGAVLRARRDPAPRRYRHS